MYPCSGSDLGVATVGYVGDSVVLGCSWNVCLRTITCSCGLMKQICGPCRHFYAVAEHFKVVIEAKHFHHSVTTTFWREIYVRCTSLIGVFPDDNQIDDIIRVRAADGIVTKVVKPWVEIDEVISMLSQRIASNGDSSGGGGVSLKRKRKADKRPCPRCTKLVSGHTRHKSGACVAFMRLVAKTRALAFWEQLTTANHTRLCFSYNRIAVRLSLAENGLDEANKDEEVELPKK